MSPKAAGLARKWGYTNVKVYVQGEPGWRKAGYCTASTAEFVKTANIVLIDLRAKDAVEAGHIPGAVNISAEELPYSMSKFPDYLGAHIVLYSNSRDDLKNAVQMIQQWGYRKVTVLPGGVNAWIAKGLNLETGPASTEIKYVRKLSPGEIGIEEFKKLLATGDAVILDVRTPEEYSQGHFKKAINIPTDEIPSRYNELPRDRLIVTHCVTGTRAEMAYNILKQKGYQVKYLKASITFIPDGSYLIEE